MGYVSKAMDPSVIDSSSSLESALSAVTWENEKRINSHGSTLAFAAGKVAAMIVANENERLAVSIDRSGETDFSQQHCKVIPLF